MNIFFCSDPHYNHTNIIKGLSTWAEGGQRDFPSLDKMNTTLVNNINNKVGYDDVLYCLGDWSFGGFDKILEFRSRVNCQQVHLILGNHDHHVERNKNGVQSLFSSVSHYKEVKIGNQTFVLFHYPIASWNGLNKGWIQLFGHVHSNILGPGKMMDVGFDSNPKFEPYSLEEVMKIVKDQGCISMLEEDHHERNR